MQAQKITFELLQERLLARINWRINNGEFTERSLARLLGISQPQMHNVRKGTRKLTVQLADRIMIKLGSDALDLLQDVEVMECLERNDPYWREKEINRKPASRETNRPIWRKEVG